MKKSLTILLALIMCMAFASCGSATITGDAETYTNKDKSVSIDLPTASEDSWIVNDKSADSVIDMSNKDDTVNIRVECVSKKQIRPIADDLTAYKDYSMVNTLGDVLADSPMDETDMDLPSFITQSLSYTFTMSGDVKGLALFMESDQCYYTYFVMAVSEAYDQNDKVFDESLMSLKELTDAAPADGAEKTE